MAERGLGHQFRGINFVETGPNHAENEILISRQT